MKNSTLGLLIALTTISTAKAQLGEAKWIGSPNCALYSNYLPTFRYYCTLELDAKSASTTASVLLGGNDPRLMQSFLNLHKVEAKRDSSYLRVELDITPHSQNKPALIHVYRACYTPTDQADKPLASFTIPTEVVPIGNGYQPIRIQIEGLASRLHLHVNDCFLGEAIVNPYGGSHDFIGYPQLCDIGYAMHPGQRATLSDVRITHHRSPHSTLYSKNKSIAIGGKKRVHHLENPSHNSMPLLRSKIKVKDKPIKNATLHATARGIYEININNKKVGNEWLAPGISQYNKTHYYQSYSVDSLLHKGVNHINVQLAEGWWMGYVTYDMNNWNFFGDQLAFRSKLIINYEDGDSTCLYTSPDTWEVCTDGPVRYGSLFMGQVTDARQKANKWIKAEELTLEGHLPNESTATTPPIHDYSQQQLLPSATSVQAFTTLTAKDVYEIHPGAYIYDMGQNFAGVPCIQLPALPKGTQVRMRFAEVVYPNLPAYKDVVGTLMLENIRAAMAQDLYISDGKPAVILPRYTQHGFRFIEISGIPSPLPKECVQGKVLSSIDQFTAHFECSNQLVNRLWDNIRWSTLANFISLPTDCPQRNERMGWSGDISVYARTATYLWNCKEFLRKHLRSMRDIQSPEGRFPDVAPIGGGFGGFLWGTAGITVPWELWLQYADIQILKEHYEAMRNYMEYVENHYISKSSGLFVQADNEAKLGDWLGLEDNKNDKSLLFECYYIYDLDIMTKVATLLGHREDAKQYEKKLQERKDFFCKTYIERSTGKTIASAFDNTRAGQTIDIQGSYVLPLAFDVADDDLKTKMLNNLVNSITRSNQTDTGVKCAPYSLMTGFITTSWISRVLTDGGHADVAYRLLQNKNYPSWLYPITQGATTIWERLNSYTHTDGFGGNNAMNSFNHYSFGAVGQWLVNRCLGIERDENQPGFKHFYLKPVPDPTGEMTFARGHYDSPFGRIESSWERLPDGGIKYRFVVPCGTTATLLLPGHTPIILQPGSYSF